MEDSKRLDAAAPVRRSMEVRLHGKSDAERFLVSNSRTHRYFRLGAREYGLLETLGEPHSTAELMRDCGPSWSSIELLTCLERFRTLGLLKEAEEERETPLAWFQQLFRDPLRIRLVAFDPSRLCGALGQLLPPISVLSGSFLGSLVALLILIPFLQAPAVQILRRPLSPADALVVLLGFILSLSLHELAHGIVCHRLGGEVHRMGLMLLCFVPVCFCDVTDAWRFRDRQRRVAVALAGVAAQFWLAIGSSLLWLRTGFTACLLFAMLTTLFAVANLFPLWKMDGFWLLALWLDEPNLWAKSIRTCTGLFGPKARAPLPRRFAILGALELITSGGAILVGLSVVHAVIGALWGVAGPIILRVLWMTGSSCLCVWLALGLVRKTVKWRHLAAGVGLALVLLALGTAISVHQSIRLSFRTTPENGLALYAKMQDERLLRANVQVDLFAHNAILPLPGGVGTIRQVSSETAWISPVDEQLVLLPWMPQERRVILSAEGATALTHGFAIARVRVPLTAYLWRWALGEVGSF